MAAARGVGLAGGNTGERLIEFAAQPGIAALDPALAARWEAVRSARRVVTAALEVQRAAKVIGASLEARPVVHLADPALAEAVAGVDFAEVCITSGLEIVAGAGPADAFRLEDVAGVAVVFRPAEGEKCARCWQILPDVGSHAHAGTCARCDAALG